MTNARGEITVYYDGACPRCIRDRERYERRGDEAGGAVRWVDVNGREAALRAKGIDPVQALRELHVEDTQGHIHRELEAYYPADVASAPLAAAGLADRTARSQALAVLGLSAHGTAQTGLKRAKLKS